MIGMENRSHQTLSLEAQVKKFAPQIALGYCLESINQKGEVVLHPSNGFWRLEPFEPPYGVPRAACASSTKLSLGGLRRRRTRRPPCRHATFVNLGRHELSIDLDLMTLRWHGVPSLEDIQAAMTRAEGVLQSAGSLFVLVDMRDAGPAGTDARRYMQQWLGRHPGCVMALFGVSLPARVVLLLISRAMVLLGIPSPVYTLFSNEAEARAWIEARRRSVQPAPSP